MKKSLKLGFSLIELSITLLIISILTGAVASGAFLIEQSKLKSARSLTINSPVNSIKNLHLWVESTLEKSFDADINDTDSVSNWYDISYNTQKINLSGGAASPSYAISIINNLPAVTFDGSDDCLLNAASLFPHGDYSIFVVFSADTINSTRNLVSLVNSSAQLGTGIQFSSSGEITALHRFPFSGVGDDALTSSANQFIANKNYIISYVRNINSPHTTNSVVKLNNTSIIDSTSTKANLDTTSLIFSVGCLGNETLPFDGNIGEVIIFKRTLTSDEESAIQKYLSAKWGIKLN
jgi:prepilin-type N-terminal cleavage/methylation domain-containing protein